MMLGVNDVDVFKFGVNNDGINIVGVNIVNVSINDVRRQ